MLARQPTSAARCSTSHHVAPRLAPQAQRLAPPRAANYASTSGLDKEALKGVKVLVAGAAGGTGRQVVDVLVEAGVPCRALVRDVDAARQKLRADPLVELVQGDVTSYSSLAKAAGDANALICATGATERLDPLGPFNVDFQGNLNLLALSRQQRFKKLVLVSSIGADDLVNPLNLFWGILFWKRQAERDIERSGIDYTIIRPGGLKSKLREGEQAGNVVMKGARSYGVPPLGKAGSILRRQVAELCVAALYEPDAANKIVEVIAERDEPALSFHELYRGVQ